MPRHGHFPVRLNPQRVSAPPLLVFIDPARKNAQRDRSLDHGRPQQIPREDNQDRTSGSGTHKVERPEGRGFKSHRSRFDVMDFVLLSLAFSNSVTVSEHLIFTGSEMGVFYGFSRVDSYTVVSGQVDRFRWSEVSCGEETASAHAMTKSTS